MNVSEIPPHKWKFERYELDELRRELRLDGVRIALESKLFDFLRELVVHAGQVVTKADLYRSIWPESKDDPVGSLNNAASKLRRILGSAGHQLIVTVPGTGYKLVSTVTPIREAEPVYRTPELRQGDSVPGREQWRLQRLLGASPGSAVWVCEHVKTAEMRVFKFAFNGIRLERLKREVAVARLLARLEDARANFVRVLEWNFEAVPFFLESEDGGPNMLGWAQAAGGLERFPMSQRVQVLARVAKAVAAAHEVGVIHKDLKPANILIGSSDGDLGIKVSDFDLASLTDPSRLGAFQITNPGFKDCAGEDGASGAGTAPYVAPEVLRGKTPTSSADVYALGVMLYQLVICDFRAKLSAGWEAEVEDAVLREDIAAAANSSPDRRPSAIQLAQRLLTIPERHTELRQRAAAQARIQIAERKVAAARARRPWVVVAIVTLLVGCIVSFILLRRTIQERDRANRETTREAATNRFLSQSILGRADPFKSGSAGESLEDAVSQASPEIDSQFRNDPLIAGRLHLIIANALDARSSFPRAREEYNHAIALLQKADGARSQDAILARLLEAGMEARTYQPGALAVAQSLLREAESDLSRVADPRKELEVWRFWAHGIIDLAETNPRSAIQSFSTALRHAHALPGFDPASRFRIRERLAFSYNRLPDGVKGEQLFRQLIAESAASQDKDSLQILTLRTSLAQSLFVQGKYGEAIQEADRIYPLLAAKLGTDNEAPMRVLGVRAASEGHLALWDRAIRDDLAIYDVAVRKQGQIAFFPVATLSDAGLSECRAGRYSAGTQKTRRAYEQSKQIPKQTGMTGATAYAWAYCLIGEDKLDEAATRLEEIDIQAVTHLTGEQSVAGDVALAKGRIALRRGNYEAALKYSQAAALAFAGSGVDETDRRELRQLQQAIAKLSRGASSRSTASHTNSERNRKSKMFHGNRSLDLPQGDSRPTQRT
ncbi:MAG: winged helix-turn-helix domain-containing protein [Acidobacteriaceae bacterium]|nr:winged helix-turn-helix domain-containing protein [Acidobacteriaceae bacterium]